MNVQLMLQGLFIVIIGALNYIFPNIFVFFIPKSRRKYRNLKIHRYASIVFFLIGISIMIWGYLL